MYSRFCVSYDDMSRLLDCDYQEFNDRSYSYSPVSQLQRTALTMR
ncbi:hypothetical protein [Pseudidiomarina terrestris]|nr:MULTISPECIES: hypothetical protein [unclassified Pseudidiomarina]